MIVWLKFIIFNIKEFFYIFAAFITCLFLLQNSDLDFIVWKGYIEFDIYSLN